MSHSREETSEQRCVADERDRLAAIIRTVPQGIVLYDQAACLVLFNERFCALYGVSAEGLRVGMTLLDVIEACRSAGCYAERRLEDVHAELKTLLRGRAAALMDRPARDRLVAVRSSAMDDGGWVCTFEDATERQHDWDHLAFMAHHDSLTGLANRDMLTKRFATEIARCRRGQTQFALLCLDLDRFKAINDSLGHSAGDALLQQVAARLRGLTRQMDTVARTGGDEFIILQGAVSQPAAAAALADRLVETLAEPFDLHGATVRIGTSVGIAIFPDDGADADELLRNADVALYSAKADGRGRFCRYDHAIGERQRLRRLLEEDLRGAVGTDQLQLHYQPIIDCARDTVRGFEALMRWTHPLIGPISPDLFIPIAEETGLINALGLWALETACEQAATWPGRLSVAVNLSPAQFFTGDLHEEVARILRTTGLLASRLELEVTEGVLITNTDQALAALQALRAIGVGLALDDFGTGYASLGYLQRFPFSRLKIARNFVQALNQNMGADGIVAAILAMSRSLFLDVTAEGIETAGQLAILRQHGCGAVQGNLLCKPLMADAIADYLRRPSGFMGGAAAAGGRDLLLS